MRTYVVGRAWIRGSEGERADQAEMIEIIIYVPCTLLFIIYFFFSGGRFLLLLLE